MVRVLDYCFHRVCAGQGPRPERISNLIWVSVPEAINVEVPGILATNANANRRVGVADCLYTHPETGPQLQSCVVIPIPLQQHLPTAGKKRYFEVDLAPIVNAKLERSSKQVWKLRYEAHALTVAFALTYQKLQAQTKKKLILDLNSPPRKLGRLTFMSVYVGWSRVRERAGLRTFPLFKRKASRNRTNNTHLKAMKHDPRLIKYLTGFAGDGSQYQPTAIRAHTAA
jgi:hypothetical protein